MIRALHAVRRPPPGPAPRSPRPLQGVSRYLLARARRGPSVSRRVRSSADRRGVSRRADSRGVRRLGPRRHRSVDHPRGGQPQRRQCRSLSRADVHDGHAAAARIRCAEARVPATDRQRRAAAAGVRRHRTDHGIGHDAAEDNGDAQRRSIRHPWSEGVDLARRALGSPAARRPHDANRTGRRSGPMACRCCWSIFGRRSGTG